jgi:phosphatidylglycerophosphate synthase
MSSAIAGTAIVLAASYLDCCDGEIARIKLLSSRLGAWIDTIVDELSSVGYTIALGWHCHLHFGPGYLGALGFDPWLAAIALDLVTFAVSIYCIYYNIIVAVGSANSQDYTQRFEIVPGAQPNAVRLQPAHVIASTRELPRWLAWIVTYLPYVVRRDFLAWGALVLAVLHLTQVLFALMSAGAAITFIVVTIDHVKFRRIVRQGHVLESPT